MGSLRVITGKAKGHTLQSVPGDITRPIMDRVKESLFNILGADIRDATMLDLFGGTGAVGIEALSRGARFVRFVDRHPLAVGTIRTNLEKTKLDSDAEVWHQDAFDLLAEDPDRRFDYVYIAPPQYKRLWLRALRNLDDHPQWLTDYAWVIVQIDPVEEEPVDLKNLQEFDRRQYGSTLLLFYILPPRDNHEGTES